MFIYFYYNKARYECNKKEGMKFNMNDKFKLSQEQNMFLAKRNIIDSIWKSANLEGIAITFPETQKIYEGGNIEHLRVDEIVTINNLKHAWQFILNSINENINFNYISSIHSLVGSNLVDSPGKIRAYEVKMAGTNWIPELPSKEKLENLLKEVQIIECETEKILTLMCKLMKMQLFNDGNKRTSMLIANHELIKKGRGILTVSEENKVEFGTKLIQYYENENKLNELIEFIYNKCLDGIKS